MELHLSKYQKLIPAPTLVCSLADDETEVSMDSLWRARAWGDSSRAMPPEPTEQAPARTPMAPPPCSPRSRLGFAVHDVYLKGLANLNIREAVKAAAALLCDLEHLRRVDTKPDDGAESRPQAIRSTRKRRARGRSIPGRQGRQ